MRYTADVTFTRHPLDHDGRVKTESIEASERTWDNVEADDLADAQSEVHYVLQVDEPNLIEVTHMTVKQYEYKGE